MDTIELGVDGMTCGACIRHVEAALRPLDGVETVQVNLQAGRVRVAGDVAPQALIDALDQAGYTARVSAPQADASTNRPGRCGCGCP